MTDLSDSANPITFQGIFQPRRAPHNFLDTRGHMGVQRDDFIAQSCLSLIITDVYAGAVVVAADEESLGATRMYHPTPCALSCDLPLCTR